MKTPMSYTQKTKALIGAASGWGAQCRQTELGPRAVHDAGLLEKLTSSNIVVTWSDNIRPLQQSSEIALACGKPTLPFVLSHIQRLSESVRRVMGNKQFPVIIGGDHSIAIGTWTGVVSSLGLAENFGLLWIDAHMDAHTPETSPSQAYHGMPVSALLGYGEEQLANFEGFSPKIKPEHVILMGIRSFEQGEADLLQRLGVRIYFMEEIAERGFDAVFREAINLLRSKTAGFGVSIDVDAFDPVDAPGVGSPSNNGLKAGDVLDSLSLLQTTPEFHALEIAEYNPAFDRDGKTANLVINLLKAALPR